MLSIDELSKDEEFLRKLTQIILKNISNEQFGVENLSQEIGLSRSHLYRRLKLLKGQSISYFIRQIRMEEAMKLLQKDVGTVSEIAYRVGFNTPSYFNKCFHNHYGYAPGEVKNLSPKAFLSPKTPLPETNKDLYKTSWRRKILLIMAGLVTIGVIFLKNSSTDSTTNNNEIRSIAILPLVPLSKDLDQSYLAMGMHDAIIGEIGKINGLRVISRASTLPFSRNTDKSLPDIAKKLGVQAIIEGSVFIIGDSIRLQIQLIEVFPKEKHLWSQEYYEKISDVLSIQSELVQDIASEVNLKLSPNNKKKLIQKHDINPETYRHFLRGMYHLNKNTGEGFEEGIMHLNKAIASDPADPFAYSGLALGYAISGHGPTAQGDMVMKRAKAAALQALQLDKNMSNAHTALALVYIYHEWEWDKAKISFDKALEINPNNEYAHAHLAWLYLLFDNKELAVHHAQLASEINPLYPTYHLWLAWIHQLTGNYDLAIKGAQNLLKLEPNFTFAHYIIGNSFYDQGKFETAIESYEKIGFKNDLILASLGGAYANLENKEKVAQILKEMQVMQSKNLVNPAYMAFFQATINEKDSAMIYLNKGLKNKTYPLPWAKCVAPFKFMKKDSSFISLYKQMNLPL